MRSVFSRRLVCIPRPLLGAVAWLASVLATAPSAYAAPVAPAVTPASDPPEVEALGQRLRCPVCQGMPIGESPAPMAQDMMKQVRRMWAEGRSDHEIETYFTDRFGTWVLLDPPREGVALWVWLLPPVGGGAALMLVLLRVLRRTQTSRHAPIVDGLGIAAGAPEAANDAPNETLAAIRRQV